MEFEQDHVVINKLRNVYECKAGHITDLVLAETRDHAAIKFRQLQSTILGSPITVDIDVKFLYKA